MSASDQKLLTFAPQPGQANETSWTSNVRVYPTATPDTLNISGDATKSGIAFADKSQSISVS
jgi:hypothetical protein